MYTIGERPPPPSGEKFLGVTDLSSGKKRSGEVDATDRRKEHQAYNHTRNQENHEKTTKDNHSARYDNKQQRTSHAGDMLE